MEQSKSLLYFNYVLALLLALIPFIQISSLADPTLLSRQMAACFGGLLLCLILALNYKQILLPINKWPVYFALVWLLGSALSITYAYNQQEAYYSFSKTCLYVGLLLSVSTGIQSGLLSIKHLSIGVVLASIVGLIYFSMEVNKNLSLGIKLWDQKNLYAIKTVFGHKNLYSSFQMLCLPFWLYSYSYLKNYQKIVASILLLAMLGSLILIQTKAVLIALIIASMICLPIAAKHLLNASKKQILILLFLYLLGLLACVFVVLQFPQKFTLILNNDTIQERILLWNNTLEMIKENGFMGVGAGNWQIYFPKYGLEAFLKTNYLVSDGYTTFQRPHNDFLWIASELGIIGFVGYLMLFISALFMAFKNLKIANSVHQKLLLILCLFTLIGYIFVALVDFPLERNEHQVLVAILLAIVFGSNQISKTEKRKNAYWIITLSGVLFSFSLYNSVVRLPQEKEAKKLIQAHASGNFTGMIAIANKIDREVYSIDNFSIPIAWYLGVAHFSLGNTVLAKKLFLEAYEVNPYQVHVLNNLAGLYEFEGKHEEAITYYNLLLAISPKQPDAILNKSAVLFNMGKIEEAMRCIYQFKYDETNTQFLQYLHLIGRSYLELPYLKNKQTPPKILENQDYIKSYFRLNQEKKHTFENLETIQHD